MGLFNQFPYTNFHELNLNWILDEVKKLRTYIEEYTAVNKVGYAGIWDITNQYPQWSVVSNGDKSYLSTVPVPVGVDIVNTDYWTELADLDPRYGTIVEQLETLETAVQSIRSEMAYGFPDVDIMAQTDIPKGSVAVCYGRNGHDVATFWKIEASKQDVASVPLNNGLYANYVRTGGSGGENVLGLGAQTYPSPCSTTIQQLLSAGYDSLYFPAGKYLMSLTITDSTIIRGNNQSQYSPVYGFESAYDTIFRPDGNPVITINAVGGSVTNCIFENFEIAGFDQADSKNDGIVTTGAVDTELVDHNIFRNILVRGCYRGISWVSRGIWNTFDNVRLYGNLGIGLNIIPPEDCAFNHNSFNDCSFSSNMGGGVVFASAQNNYKNNANFFNHCNIEMNNLNYSSGNDVFAVFAINSHGIAFNDCYFEANKGTCTIWLNSSDATITSGVSIIPNTPLVGVVNNGMCIVAGLHGYNAESLELCDPATQEDTVCVIGSRNLGYKTDVGAVKVVW